MMNKLLTFEKKEYLCKVKIRKSIFGKQNIALYLPAEQTKAIMAHN